MPERGVVKSCEPFEFWWAPTVFLELLIVSGAVNLGGWQHGKLVTGIIKVYHTDRRHLSTARWVQGTASRGSVSGSGDVYFFMSH